MRYSEFKSTLVELHRDTAGIINESTFNRGDVAEVILGAAVTAKFLKKDDSNVSIPEVERIIKETIGLQNIEYQRIDTVDTEKVFDNITFRISVPKKAINFLKGKDFSGVNDLFLSAIEYVNTNRRLTRQAKVLRSNAKVDDITIKSDGVGDQKGTKADIKLTVNGKTTRNQISLKVAGGEQFAQVSGASFDKQVALWNEGLGIDVQSLKDAYNSTMESFKTGLKFASREEEGVKEQKDIVKTAMRIVYQYAANELNDKFKAHEEEFIENFINFISRGIAGDEERYIELVKLERGQFKTIRPGSKSFKDSIKNLDLVAELRRTGDPQITISDRNTKSPLIRIRARVELAKSETKQGKLYYIYPRNYVEAPTHSLLYLL